MRIAVSGTHRVGKTSLLEIFVDARPHYTLEREPYERMIDEGEARLDDLSVDAFQCQLEYHAARASLRAAENDVIFERCAVDFLAYMSASGMLEYGAPNLSDDTIHLARAALESIELIVYLPLRLNSGSLLDSEDESYRKAVDRSLDRILSTDVLGLFARDRAPRILTLSGSTPRRLRRLLDWLEREERGLNSPF